MKKVFVFGSINTDIVISADRLPMKGESLRGKGFMVNQGGKGANQAVACKKLGCEDVYFIGAVGDDLFGKQLKSSLDGYGIDTSALQELQGIASGSCVIVLDSVNKDNYLIVDPSANEKIGSGAFDFLREKATTGDIFVAQLEIAYETLVCALRIAKERGMYTVLNPAPAAKIGVELLQNVDLIVLNETEAQLIAGINVQDENTARECYEYFADFGVQEVVVTLGGAGSIYVNERETVVCPAFRVEAVDTTSAGDTFIGALVMKKASNEKVGDHLRFASLCSAITVSRTGAAVSIPTYEEVKEFEKKALDLGKDL